MEKYPKYFQFSISYTTREQRPGEQHGKDYFFVSEETFKKEIEKKKFLEYNKVHGNYYGTHRDVIADVVNSKKICLLDIDIQGLKMAMRNGLLVAYKLFIMPPNLNELKERLRKRNSETDETIELRVKTAAHEIQMANQLNIFHAVITNTELKEFNEACDKLLEKWYPFIKNI